MYERLAVIPPIVAAQFVRAATAFALTAIGLMFAMGALLKSPGVMLAAVAVAGLSYVSQTSIAWGEMIYQATAEDGVAPPNDTAASAQRAGNYVMLIAVAVYLLAFLYLAAMVTA